MPSSRSWEPLVTPSYTAPTSAAAPLPALIPFGTPDSRSRCCPAAFPIAIPMWVEAPTLRTFPQRRSTALFRAATEEAPIRSTASSRSWLRDASSLVYSTYLGGTSGDTVLGIAVDAAGNAYVTGGTNDSQPPNTFPIKNPVQSFGGTVDAFIAKLNPAGTSLVYSTYLGGGGYDAGTGIAVDTSGNAYVSGFTYSGDFPVASGVQNTFGNPGVNFATKNGFIAKLNAAGNAFNYVTYLGGISAGLLGGPVVTLPAMHTSLATPTRLTFLSPRTNCSAHRQRRGIFYAVPMAAAPSRPPRCLRLRYRWQPTSPRLRISSTSEPLATDCSEAPMRARPSRALGSRADTSMAS